MAKRKRPASTAKPRAPKVPRTNYTLYETFADPKIPVEDVAQGMARAVAYDEDATQQVLALLAKAAGLKGAPQIEVGDAQGTALKLETLCEGCVAAYPLANSRQGHRFDDLVAQFYTVLHDSQSDESLLEVVPFVAALAGVHLRSLRHAATAFAAALSRAAAPATIASPAPSRVRSRARTSSEVEQLRQALAAVLKKRVLDVAPEIREIAVAAAPFSAHSLNDEAPGVRLAALAAGAAATLSDTDLARVVEIAQRDVDPRCRAAAIALLPDSTNAGDTGDASDGSDAEEEPLLDLLTDPEPIVAAAAAAKFLQTRSLESVPDHVSHAAAIALAREAKLSVEEAVDLAVKTESLALLDGAATATKDAEDRAAALVPGISRLLSQFSHADALIAATIRLFRHVDLDAALARNLEQDISRLLQDACAAYTQHPNAHVQAAVSTLVRPLLEHPAFAHSARTQLSETLEQLMLSEADLGARTAQIAALGRFIDISDFASQDLYATDSPHVRAFARNVAFHGDMAAVSDALEYLGSLENATDDILKLLIVARVRSLNIDFDTASLDLELAEKRTIDAARAAQLIE